MVTERQVVEHSLDDIARAVMVGAKQNDCVLANILEMMDNAKAAVHVLKLCMSIDISSFDCFLCLCYLKRRLR